MRQFNANSPFMFIICGVVVVFVLAQSVFFLVRALKRAKELGMAGKTVNKVMISSAIFTIAPAISILLGVITLSKFLGIPLPWMRLSVVGSLTYELTAASSAVTSLGLTVENMITDPKIFATVAWVMAIGIMSGFGIIAVYLKKILGGVMKLKQKDSRWGDIFMTSMFVGMISAFLGLIFGEIRMGLEGWIPVFVFLTSVVIMLICGFVSKVLKQKWIEEFALPITMLTSMGMAIVITNLVTKVVA